ncbi:F1F0 ATP synthase subunit e, mitochondrial [Basidiobolus ranarum]|uniref:ATP synthase F(0) complex subunit e, mitochondrial n=1 Tax=Basidiobolus ranarum TaxID=34480 RepID=A0ABR2W8T6_9FUNG
MAPASPLVNVSRYAALVLGLSYGFVHRRNLEKSEGQKRIVREYQRKEDLIEEAKAAYAKKKIAETVAPSSGVITDPEHPDFDLEKVVEQFEKNN